MSYVFVLNASTLQGMNTYHRTQNLSKHYSVTVFLNSEPTINSNNFPECNDTKKISDPVEQTVNWTYIKRSEDVLDIFWTSYVRSVYVLCLQGTIFLKQKQPFPKNIKITEYSRTARVDEKENVCEIVKKLLDRDESYLRHWSHMDNIAAILPMIRESFSGKYIELDFSENLVLKPKHEVQNAPFSGKQYLFLVQLLNLVKINTYRLPFEWWHKPWSCICTWSFRRHF